MSSLACVAAEVNESTSSAFLIAFQQHAAAMGFFKPIADHLRVKMKEVRYSVLQKGQTLVASILLGCPYTSSINHRLVPDQVSAQEWGMERSPDQSQINLFLNRMTAENVVQLEQAHQELLQSHSLLRSAPRVVVDFDQTGLRVTACSHAAPRQPGQHDGVLVAPDDLPKHLPAGDSLDRRGHRVDNWRGTQSDWALFHSSLPEPAVLVSQQRALQ